MTGSRPAALRRPLGPSWPLPARAIVGAGLGLLAHALAEGPAPSWRAPFAAGVVAVVAIAAPTSARLTAWGGTPGFGLAATIGLYLGVPETDHVVGLGVGLAPFVAAELLDRSRASAAATVAVGTAVMWAAMHGSGTREVALLAGTGALGLLLVAPVVAALPGPHRALTPPSLRGGVVAGLQLVGAAAIGRRGAVADTVAEVVVTTLAGLVALIVLTRLAHGPRRSGRR